MWPYNAIGTHLNGGGIKIILDKFNKVILRGQGLLTYCIFD